ncbi:MAG: cob(I)yrinic acid a,c-diamide adenosyltransferase [Pseudomonadota bacterium]|nr:cob(I)yrinic acid a,c-diamide adenosyltransferase [Pseudomonadota bacterium]
MADLSTDEPHRQRMARKKAVVDAAIARAADERGLLLVLTGNGKGKSSSAFGMVARALGYGLRVAVAQFIKGRRDTGEEAFFRDLPGVTWHVLGEGFTWETQNRAQDIETAQEGWAVAQALLTDPGIHLVILDELTYLLRYGYLDTDAVLATIAARPPSQHVIVTGRGAPSSLVALADTVTEMRDVKHAFRAGVKAQKGIDL